MPPKGKLPAAVVADFAKWIDAGAADPAGRVNECRRHRLGQGPQFWSFQPVVKPAVPAGPEVNPDRPLHPRQAGREGAHARRRPPNAGRWSAGRLRPDRPAADAGGGRRVPQGRVAGRLREARRRLLASPHYGERWGRHWLDVARYAEDQAHTFGVKPNADAWRYRDWVIDAFNDDMPYDRFVKLQIAADLMPDDAGRVRAPAGPRLLRPGRRVLQEHRRGQGDRRRAGRPRGHADARLPRPDGRLRPLPRPQVRPDPDAGLLLAGRRLQQLQAGRRAARSARPRSSASTTRTRRSRRGRRGVKDFLADRTGKHRAAKADDRPKYMLAAWQAAARAMQKIGRRRPATDRRRPNSLDAADARPDEPLLAEARRRRDDTTGRKHAAARSRSQPRPRGRRRCPRTFQAEARRPAGSKVTRARAQGGPRAGPVRRQRRVFPLKDADAGRRHGRGQQGEARPDEGRAGRRGEEGRRRRAADRPRTGRSDARPT